MLLSSLHSFILMRGVPLWLCLFWSTRIGYGGRWQVMVVVVAGVTINSRGKVH